MSEANNAFTTMIIDSLTRIPFFRGLPPEALSAISAKLQRIRLEHGAVVFTQDELGDAMYLIESGQIKVSVNVGAGQPEKVVNYLGPGNFFGEMALLLNQRRSATVTVSIDADLWVLRKADMDELLVDYPVIALQITKELSRRLTDVVTENTRRPGYTVSAVFGTEAWRLANSIYNLTRQRVIVLDITGEDIAAQAQLPDDNFVILEAMENLSTENFGETLGILADGFDWVLLALPTNYSEVGAKAVQLAKAAVLFNKSDPDWIKSYSEGPIFYCNGTQTEIDRTARKITHCIVGLALSSGGARGIAHIGVLEMLEKAGIPVDMIAGTSAGSLFGGLYSSGRSVEEVADFARNLIKLIDLKSGLWDPKLRLPWSGLIKGNATAKYLARQFNDATFADTRIPFYVVAADVISGEEVVFESGPIAEAVRASIGMIGIFAPYQLNEHHLIDGGAVNPVPASVLAEKGANIIIASNVIPSLEAERARGKDAAYRNQNPNFLGVLSNMMSIMEREIVKTRMTPVDVLIKPKVEVYSAMNYDKAEEFLQIGRSAAEEALPLIKKLLNH